jgi:succinate dehydrogenase/fumarate reductase-like Fe-S protein
MDKAPVTVEISRNNEQGETYTQTFVIPYETRMNVLSMLHTIYENQDPTLAFRVTQCSRGICDSCMMRLDGKKIKACSVLVKPGQHLRLTPANDRVVRDLVTAQD